MRLIFALAFVLSVMLLVASKAGAVPVGTEQIDLRARVQVDVIEKLTPQLWKARKATVHGFADGRIIVCEEFKGKVEALCLVITDDGEAIVVPVRMLEDKV